MHLERITLKNFRCFGEMPVTVSFSKEITGLVGNNGSGKSTILEALKRLFSPIAAERIIGLQDVHFGPSENAEGVSERNVFLDAVFAFDENDKKGISLFNDMFFNEKGSDLRVRIRIEAFYKKTEALAGEISTKRYTINTLDDVDFGDEDERKVPLTGSTARFAELVYIPAHRDSIAVTRTALKRVLTRLENSADWTDKTKDDSLSAAKNLEEHLHKVPAVEEITEDLTRYWKKLHDGYYFGSPKLGVIAKEFSKLIQDLTLRFEKSPGFGQRQLEELSEGQTSLLYFALSATLHSLLWKMQSSLPKPLKGFKILEIPPSPLTIFAFEEPENHLSPFYLPRLIDLVRGLITQGSSQAVITSHSASVLNRIPPQDVRYLRMCHKSLTSTVKPIPLPDTKKAADAKQFLTQVILANPEIYFSKLVIVGEGDSERLVIPKMAEAFGIHLDPSFVAYVSIGGRHASHLWKLLIELEIPHITLLDFDLGRHQGGMGRIKNTCTWLKELGVSIDQNSIPKNEDTDKKAVQAWIETLRKHNVFYSASLDLDMMMLTAFPDAYKVSSVIKLEEGVLEKRVFGESGAGNADTKKFFSAFSKAELNAYNTLFITRSKPASHLEALSKIFEETEKDIQNKCPEPLKELILKSNEFLKPIHGDA